MSVEKRTPHVGLFMRQPRLLPGLPRFPKKIGWADELRPPYLFRRLPSNGAGRALVTLCISVASKRWGWHNVARRLFRQEVQEQMQDLFDQRGMLHRVGDGDAEAVWREARRAATRVPRFAPSLAVHLAYMGALDHADQHGLAANIQQNLARQAG